MTGFLFVLILVIATVFAVLWMAVCIVGWCVRVLVWTIGAPFRTKAGATSPHRGPGLAGDVSCANAKCHAALPAEARFCSRCGTAVGRTLPAVYPRVA